MERLSDLNQRLKELNQMMVDDTSDENEVLIEMYIIEETIDAGLFLTDEEAEYLDALEMEEIERLSAEADNYINALHDEFKPYKDEYFDTEDIPF